MNLPLRIALRYTLTRRSFHFITVITYLSVLGIVVGVAAIICVMSIFNGFGRLIEGQVIGFDPHIRIENPGGEKKEELITQIRQLDNVRSAVWTMQGRVIALREGNPRIFVLNAVSEKDKMAFADISEKVAYGKFNISPAGRYPRIVLGASLADRLRSLPGDTIVIMTPGMIEASVRTFMLKPGIRMVVSGLFQTNVKDYDDRYGFISLDAGAKIFRGTEKTRAMIDVRLDSPDRAEETALLISKIAGSETRIRTWRGLNEELFEIMRFERMSTFTVLSIIIIISVFNILVSLTMTVVEKKSDISVLKAMGADDRQVRNIFVLQGIITGLAGTFIGAALGLLLCFGQQEFGWFAVDTAKYIVSAIPVDVDPLDVVAVCGVSLLLSVVATIYPAKRAARSLIAEGILKDQ